MRNGGNGVALALPCVRWAWCVAPGTLDACWRGGCLRLPSVLLCLAPVTRVFASAASAVGLSSSWAGRAASASPAPLVAPRPLRERRWFRRSDLAALCHLMDQSREAQGWLPPSSRCFPVSFPCWWWGRAASRLAASRCGAALGAGSSWRTRDARGCVVWVMPRARAGAAGARYGRGRTVAVLLAGFVASRAPPWSGIALPGGAQCASLAARGHRRLRVKPRAGCSCACPVVERREEEVMAAVPGAGALILEELSSCSALGHEQPSTPRICPRTWQE